MRFIDPRTPEDKKTWSQRGPNIVRRPGEVRTLIWNMTPWFVPAYFMAALVGSVSLGFWISAILALAFAVLSLSVVRRRIQLGAKKKPYNNRSAFGVGIGVLLVFGLTCEWELQKRIAEFSSQHTRIVAKAERALETRDYDVIHALAYRYSVVPDRPLDPFLVRAEELGEEDYLNTPEGQIEQFVERYKKRLESQKTEIESSSGGDEQ